jgi:hypothetical protein
LSKQERGKELAALVVPVPLGYPCIFVLLRALRDSLLCLHNNFKQVLTLYPHKIKNTSAVQMRGFKENI